MSAITRRPQRCAATLLLALLPLTAAIAATPEEAPAAAAATAPDAGTPEYVGNCVRLHTIRSTKVIDGRTILFELNGNRVLVNRLPHNCPGLRFEKRFLYKTSLNQLCSQDIITVLTDIGRGASCGLGKFELYVPPETVDGGTPDKGSLEPEP